MSNKSKFLQCYFCSNRFYCECVDFKGRDKDTPCSNRRFNEEGTRSQCTFNDKGVVLVHLCSLKCQQNSVYLFEKNFINRIKSSKT